MQLPFNDDVQQALEVLRKGGVILYPTDTVWGLGCDASRSEAVKRIYQIKQREDSKALICLINSPEWLPKYAAGVPDVAYELLEAAVDPLTVVYDGALCPPLAPNLPAPDGTIALRVCSHPFCRALMRGLRRPLVSTSANVSGQAAPATFARISPEILRAVDYVCHTDRNAPPSRPSTILRLTESASVTILRP